MAVVAKPMLRERRGYYLLWSLLLGASLAAYALWRLPVRSGRALLAVRIQVKDAPAGCLADLWSMPGGTWAVAATPEGGQPLAPPGEVARELTLGVAYRRWTGDYLRGKTDDFVVLRVRPQAGEAKFLVLPLGPDWDSGFLRPGGRARISVECHWAKLRPEAEARRQLE